MTKPDERRETLVAEFAAVNEQLRQLKARPSKIHAELCELKSGSKPKQSLSKPSTSSKPLASPPKKKLSFSTLESSSSRTAKPLSQDDDFLMLGGISD
jgi:hypothetical protein